MGAEQSAMSVGVKACVGAAPEDELKALLSGLNQADYDKLRSTLLDLQTPREPPAAPDAKPEGGDAAGEGEAKAAAPPAAEAPAAEAPAAAEEAAPAAEAAAAPAAEESKAPEAAEEAPKAEENNHGLTPEQVENIKAAFKAIDKDKSDSIEFEELKIVCKAMNISTDEEDVKTMLKSIDKNGDGKIQLDEYIAMVAKSLKKA
eukprot:TRINITY_DN1299_c2_g1_i1.p1 TRINITY_DN1299_c2_g1~~TRINITY_DN1299_c2_g1_i1.p1  ORF type:complete len:226 (-),score=86.98 TRINITY_DN1299_c2_g1_i1:192-800(-)